MTVTRPERFAPLHEAAEELLDALTERFVVERRESKEPLDGLLDGPLYRTVRLVPHMPAAAPLSVSFTDFPSLRLRMGRWYRLSLPGCGCDDCEEEPDELITDLRAQVTALVEGGLWERTTRRRRALGESWSESKLIGPGFSHATTEALTSAEARTIRKDGHAAPCQWAPWPRRATD